MNYKVTDSVPYLINRAGVALGNRFSARLRAHGLTLPMYRVLAVLRQDGAKTLGELSAMVSKEQSTLSRLIGQMEEKGLVTRERPRDNARIVQIDLTPAGAALAGELMPEAIRIEATITKGMSRTEVDGLKRMLRTIYARIDDI